VRATPIPSFPQVGEGELRVWMKREIINSDYEMRLASRKGMISLREWWLSSPECSSLAPPARAGVRGVSKPQSATGEELRPLFGRTLLPSVPVLSLSKGWIGRLREHIGEFNPQKHMSHFRLERPQSCPPSRILGKAL
jgi:hypothetical protein